MPAVPVVVPTTRSLLRVVKRVFGEKILVPDSFV